MSKNQNRGANGSHGSKWIRQDKRLAIYLRDGLACCWCGHALEDGAQLTLDHLETGHSNHHESNLVTACIRCNSSRSDRTVQEFAQAVAHYLNRGASAPMILAHIAKQTQTPLKSYREQAKAMIEQRGCYSAVMAETSMGKDNDRK